MKVVTKSQADKIAKEHPGCIRTKFCTGKYDYAKRYTFSVVDLPGVVAVWPERRSDKDGVYAILYCYTTRGSE